MNILHVLSQLQPTGAETYAATLADKQLVDGHNVFIISDKLHVPTEAKYITQPIGNRKYLQRFKNIFFLRRFVIEHDISVVHAHSRAASWVCYFSLKGLKIPLVSTIHGRQHLHASSKNFNIYGDKIITVCKHLKTHLIEEVNIEGYHIDVIPNGFDFEGLSEYSTPKFIIEGPLLVIAGRTTGPKGERTAQIIQKVLPDVLTQIPNLKIRIIGGNPGFLGPKTLAFAEQLNKKYNDNIQFIGFTDNLITFLSNANLIIAAGRTAIEALWLEKPLLALGESDYHGPINEQNLQIAIASNFGDIVATLPLPPVNYEKIKQDIIHFFSHPTPNSSQIKDTISSTYNANSVHASVMSIYHAAIIKKYHPWHIPVLMYHKIPDNPINSKHRIFVTKTAFEKHLSFLHKKGFTPITFNDYHTYKTGKKSLSTFPKKPIFITFDDAYLDNLTNALPLLKKYDFKATIFSLGAEQHTYNFWDTAIGEQQEPLLNTRQKLQMQAEGIEFGAHSMNHTDLTTLPTEEAFEEIHLSKSNLERQLGKEVIAFAYPYGKVNDKVKALTHSAGFKYAVAIDSGGMHIEDDPLEIFRAYVFPEDDNYALLKKTARWYRRYFKWKRKR